jgi:hypothetical protein
MTAYEIMALDESGTKLLAPGASDTYIVPRALHFTAAVTTDSTIDGRDIAADGAVTDVAVIAGDNISDLTNDIIASQTEAETGTDNTKMMTPLGVLQAINANHKNNDNATVAPTTTNDDSEGYAVGSRWTDVSAGEVYFCLDASTNIAVWTSVSSFGDELLGDWDAGDFDIEMGSITFKPQASDLPHNAGTIYYHSEHGGHFVAYVEDADVSLQIGEEEWISVRNDTGLTIEDGTPVYIIGYSSGLPQISPIIADGERCIGLTTHSIETGTIGKVTRGGRVTGPNLTGYSVGDTLYVSTTVAGELINTRPLFPDIAIEIGTVLDNSNPGSLNVDIEHHGNRNLMSKSYNFSARTANSGTYYLGGFYNAPAADVNLTNAAPTQGFGTANSSHASHAFCVMGGATTNGTSVTLTVSGTSITDAGVRTAADSEVLYTGAAGDVALHAYYETNKKWLGGVVYTLTSNGSTFTMDFNYGFCKYEDFSNTDVNLRAGEVVGLADASDPGFALELIYHRPTGWTYSAAAFVPGPAPSVTLFGDHGAEDELIGGEQFAWKRENLDIPIDASNNEGYLLRITTTVNNCIAYMNVHALAVAL